MKTIFFTGFPGFLGSELLPRVLQRLPDDIAVCLVQAKYRSLAEERAEQLMRRFDSLADRIQLVDGFPDSAEFVALLDHHQHGRVDPPCGAKELRESAAPPSCGRKEHVALRGCAPDRGGA